MALVRGGSLPLLLGLKTSQGMGTEWGGSKLDQQQTPPPEGGVNATQRCPYSGHSQLSTPIPILAAGEEPQSTLLRLDRKGEGWGRHPTPTICIPVFQEIPNHYWLSQKINSL
jgi:hypothetical protein